MVKVLITGGNGQLGQALRGISAQYPDFECFFFTSDELDITRPDAIEKTFTTVKPDFCINTAAYTAVDKAESDAARAYQVNAEGPSYLAEACKRHEIVLLHVSTDFVFDGRQRSPYTEDDSPNPKSVYGHSKWEGERRLAETWARHFIVRTSWVFSEFGHNFLKTMLRLSEDRDRVGVVNDQTGTPTYAGDLARALFIIIERTREKERPYGIYHYSNEGSCTWYEFARALFEAFEKKTEVTPITTHDYPTPAMRPPYSVLSKEKFRTTFNTDIPSWQEGLMHCKHSFSKNKPT
ncbi:MAG TPA: dTDP-4-dehydrorhamnose reductase [Flavobacterium sp.]|nr:dTDP-4-dehydrorhamnose reductase [Flavobacterium sp.]